MKKRIIHIVLIFTVAWAIQSCNDDLLLDISEPDDLIVVDGWIENGKQAKVFLTTNSPYFTSIDSASIRDLVLSRAKVTISDGERSEVLILRSDYNYFPPFYYAGNTIFGEAGKVYTLTADYGGKSVVAETTIPPKVNIDNTYFELSEDEDSIGSVVLNWTDPQDEKNYYRIFSKRVGKDDRFISTFIIAINDQYFNGEEISFKFALAPESILSTEKTEFFRLGDTILVKLCTMDKASYDFWSSYQDEVLNATNPFASSMIDLSSNIDGDGLGIWGGYGVDVDTVFALKR